MTIRLSILSTLRSQVRRIRRSQQVRAGLVNSVSGIADYVVQPLGMLLAAPFLLHRMGVEQYGLWMIIMAAIGSSGLLSVGFSDMTTKYVAEYRGRDNWPGVVRVVRASIAINLTLGFAIAILLWTLAPFAATHVFRLQAMLQAPFLTSMHLGSIALLIRSLDSIFVSVLRAYEQYRPAVQITACARALNILSTVVIVALGHGVILIILATVIISAAGMLLLAISVRSHVGKMSFLPSWRNESLATISSFGFFTWLQTLSGIIFGQADRLIVGAVLGTSGAAYYSICTQAALPIHGLVASGFHFLFPHLSAKRSAGSLAGLRSTIVAALIINLVLATLLCLPFTLLAKPFLSLWMGAPFAARVAPSFAVVALGFGLASANVTGHYTLMALGAVRYVTFLNVIAGVVMLAAIAVLTSRLGVLGAAAGRLVYGPITWILYWKLFRLFSFRQVNFPATATLTTVTEEVY